MSDYIKREDAIKALNDATFWMTLSRESRGNGKVEWNSYVIYQQDAIDAVNNLPSVQPCEDAISRAYFTEKYEEWYKMYPDSDTAREALTMMANEIDNAPSVQPSRPKGEWRKHDEERDYCSVCKHIFKTRTLTKQDKWTTYVDDLGYNFCPNCGADMRAEQTDCHRHGIKTEDGEYIYECIGCEQTDCPWR